MRWRRPASFAGACRSPQRLRWRLPERWPSAGLAHPARRLGALDDVDVDGRRLVHAQDLVRVEVGLLDTPVLERDLAIERGRDAEDDPALDLRLHRVGIDGRAAIDRADHPPDANRSVLAHFDFSDLR